MYIMVVNLLKFRVIKFLFVNALLFLIYCIYIYYVGIPKTLARQYYLQAQQYYRIGQYDRYLELLNQSKSFYEEKYVTEEIDKRSHLFKTK